MSGFKESSGRSSLRVRQTRQSNRRARKMCDHGGPTFMFLGLPVELRVMVYTYLLGARYPGIVVRQRRKISQNGYRGPLSFGASTSSRSKSDRQIREKLDNIGILKTCKVVRNECAPILYSSQFVFKDWDALNVFRNVIGDMQRYVKHIRVTLSNYCADLASRKIDLDGFTNLRALRIRRGELSCYLRPLTSKKIVAKFTPYISTIYDIRKKCGEDPDKVFDLFDFTCRMCRHCSMNRGRATVSTPLPTLQCHLVRLGTSCDAMKEQCEEVTVQIPAALRAVLMK